MTEAATRRSGRARKSVVKFSEDVYSGNKKAVAADQSDEADPELEPDEQEQEDDAEIDELEESEGEEFQAPKAAKAKGKKAPAKKRAAPKTSRKRKAAALDDDSQASEGVEAPENEPLLKGEYAIARDNPIFEAVRHSETALELTVDEWIEAYQANGDDSEEAKGEPMAELINFVIRVSAFCERFGCSHLRYSAAAATHLSTSTKYWTSTTSWTSSLRSKMIL